MPPTQKVVLPLVILGVVVVSAIFFLLKCRRNKATLQVTRPHAITAPPLQKAPTPGKKRVHFAPYIRVKEQPTEWQLRKAGLAYTEA